LILIIISALLSTGKIRKRHQI